MARFLEAVRTGSEIPEAAEYAGVSAKTMRELRKTNADFARALTDAEDASVDYLRAEAKRRAVDGWQEPVFFKGEIVGHIQRYSDRMLELLLRARAPEFRDERTVVVSGSVTLTADDLVRARSLPQKFSVEVLEELAMAMAEHDDKPLELEEGAVRDG